MASRLPIVNVGYRSTNYWVIGEPPSRFLVDLGWPGMVSALEAELRRKGIPLHEVTHGMATHFHPDHAGAAQDLVDRGMRIVVTPEQLPHIAPMRRWMKSEDHYTEIREGGCVVVSLSESRAFLGGCGLEGQLVHTPGHSDDSVSLLLDSGEAFTGDLTDPRLVHADQAAVVTASWRALVERGARTIHPGHGPSRPVPGG